MQRKTKIGAAVATAAAAIAIPLALAGTASAEPKCGLPLGKIASATAKAPDANNSTDIWGDDVHSIGQAQKLFCTAP